MKFLNRTLETNKIENNPPHCIDVLRPVKSVKKRDK